MKAPTVPEPAGRLTIAKSSHSNQPLTQQARALGKKLPAENCRSNERGQVGCGAPASVRKSASQLRTEGARRSGR